ncbi:RHS domain-containing protein [Snodgrassella alvi]|uniref:RHS repeat protein n=1 Tax=Snodgrassella alvi TaxID=1196083 RepID=UPI003CFE3866
MIQESGADKRQSLYLYTDEGSYEPLARIDRNGNQEEHIYYFHTDLNGLPEELTDEAGEIVWECSYQLWGKPVQEIAHREVQQNLRYQGQYLDRETASWISRKTWKDLDPSLKKKFQSAQQKGLVAPTDNQGIIKLKSTESLTKVGYTHKLKILGKGGDSIIYGKQQPNGHIIFDRNQGH